MTRRASRKLITTTAMVAEATELYMVDGDGRALREIVGQRIDGVIWGTQRVERKLLVQVLEIHIEASQSVEATAVLRGVCQFIEEMPYFVSS